MSTTFLVSLMLPLSVVFILPLTSKKLRAQLANDTVAAIMFGIAAILAFALPFFAQAAARTHNFAIVKGLLLAVGVFAVAGIAFGISRSIKMSRAVKTKI
ncbi:MAG TPA: hypothetical protein VIM56_03650 [Rhizomicrobium sp.]